MKSLLTLLILIGMLSLSAEDERMDDHPIILAENIWHAIDLKNLDCDSAYRVLVREINAPIVSLIILIQGDRQKIVWRSLGGNDVLARASITTANFSGSEMDWKIRTLTKNLGTVDKSQWRDFAGLDGYTFRVEKVDQTSKTTDAFQWITGEIGGGNAQAELEILIATLWNDLIDYDDAMPEVSKIVIEASNTDSE